MGGDVHEINIQQVRGHWEVYINGEFYCSADSYSEVMKEIRDVCEGRMRV